MKDTIFTGMATAIVTPMTETGIDYDALGRFIYLLDAMVDYDRGQKKGKYNPCLAMGAEKDTKKWEEYLVLTMGRCTDAYERLPLVQDKEILDNILYSGVWASHAGRKKEGKANV